MQHRLKRELNLDKHDLANYPFLELAKKQVDVGDVEAWLRGPEGQSMLQAGAEKLQRAINNEDDRPEMKDARKEILVFATARMIASCCEQSIEACRAIANYDARIAFYRLNKDTSDTFEHVLSLFDLKPGMEYIPVIQWVDLTAPVKEQKIKLCKRKVKAGRVEIAKGELIPVCGMAVKRLLLSDLPKPMTDEMAEIVRPFTLAITEAIKTRQTVDYGELNETAFPPCMKHLLTDMGNGVNLSHPARCFIVTFLHHIGLEPGSIIKFFERQPDFNYDQCQYQFGHLLNGNYKPHACASLKVNGLCAKGLDHKCKTINHPLNYYKWAKKSIEAKALKQKPLTPAAAPPQATA